MVTVIRPLGVARNAPKPAALSFPGSILGWLCSQGMRRGPSKMPHRGWVLLSGGGVRRQFWVFLFLFAGLAACDDSAVDTLAPKDDLEFAKKYVALLPARDFEAIEVKLDLKLKGPDLRATLEKIAAFFPKGSPIKVETVTWNSNLANSVTTETFQFQYQYPGQWLLATVVFEKHDTTIVVTGIYVAPLKQSVEASSSLSLADMTVEKYVFLILAVAIPLFILFTIVVCIRTRMSRWKWLWIAFMLVGVVQITISWATGDVTIQPLSVVLLGVGLFSSATSGAALTISVPLGAILFLVMRGRWRRKSRRETLDQF